MAKPNEITFDIENYDGNETEMFADIGGVLKILAKNGYVCTFTCDEPSFQIYVVDFDYEDEELCNMKPYWLTPEQYEKAVEEKEEEDGEESTKRTD